jgi:hypothetical protein
MADPAPSTPNPENVYPIGDSRKYYMRLSLGQYERPKPKSPAAIVPKTHILLPLPTELRDDTTVSYTNVNLETVGDAINGSNGLLNAAAARSAGNVLGAAFGATGRGLNKALSGEGASLLSKATAALGGGFVNILQSLLPPEQINSALQQMNGIAPNPNPSVAFQGPVLRDFTMSWAFYPKNKTEATEIDKMIRILKSRALPTWNKGNDSSILNYPYVCQLNFFPWDAKGAGPFGWDPTRSIIRIKKCFMAGVNANYNAYGTPSFFEGDFNYPTSIQLTISFKEIEYLTSEDWDKGFADSETEARVDKNGNGFNAADAIGTTVGVVSDTVGKLTTGLFTVFGEELLGAFTPEQQEVQAAKDASDARIKSLPADGSNPITYTDYGYLTGVRSWEIKGDGEGKYIVTKSSTSSSGADAPPTTSTEELKFNSLDELNTYLSSGNGPIGSGVQPDAPKEETQ